MIPQVLPYLTNPKLYPNGVGDYAIKFTITAYTFSYYLFQLQYSVVTVDIIPCFAEMYVLVL